MHLKTVDRATSPASKKTSVRSPKSQAAKAAADRFVLRGSVILDADDFARFEQCMTSPQRPSALMQEGIKRHRAMTRYENPGLVHRQG